MDTWLHDTSGSQMKLGLIQTIWNLKKKRQDSIEKADLAIYGYDINDPEEIKKNIVKYAADSLLTIWQNLKTKEFNGT